MLAQMAGAGSRARIWLASFGVLVCLGLFAAGVVLLTLGHLIGLAPATR
jgi:hypothetical protein